MSVVLQRLMIQSRYPVIGSFSQMHDGNDEDTVFLDSIENSIWKAMRLTSPDASTEKRPRFRMVKRPPNSLANFCGEFNTQSKLS